MNDVIDMSLSEDIESARIDRPVRVRDDSHNEGVRIRAQRYRPKAFLSAGTLLRDTGT